MEISKFIYTLTENEQARLLLAGLNDLAYIYDTEGNIVFVNKVFEKLTGHRSEEFCGKPLTSLFEEDDIKKVLDTYTRTLQGESPHYEIYFRNTKVFCEYKNSPLTDERGNIIGVAGIARDITLRREREEELKALNKSLEKRVVEHSTKLMKINEELTEEMNDHKRIETEFKQDIEKLQRSLRIIIHILASTIESKDIFAADHQKRVTRLARCIAEEMGLLKDRVDSICLAAALHDIGKVSVPAEILGKVEQLTESELNVLKAHSRVGYDIVREIEFPFPVAQIVLQHHERIDGSGYPMRLTSKDILLEAKILSVADVVEAISFPRPYRSTFGLDNALEEISRNKGILYDFNVVNACLTVFHEKGFTFEQELYSNVKLLDDVLLRR